MIVDCEEDEDKECLKDTCALQFTAAASAGREADLGHKQSLLMQMADNEGGMLSVDQPSPRPPDDLTDRPQCVRLKRFLWKKAGDSPRLQNRFRFKNPTGL